MPARAGPGVSPDPPRAGSEPQGWAWGLEGTRGRQEAELWGGLMVTLVPKTHPVSLLNCADGTVYSTAMTALLNCADGTEGTAVQMK